MADPTADIVAAIENGRLGDTLTQPLTKREVDALVECSASDAGAPLEPDMLARLAITKSQSPAEFERIIARLKGETDVRIAPLEDLIRKQATAERQSSGQGQAVSLSEIESWEEAVDAKSLLDQMVREIRRYVALSAASALSVALWIMHSYCYSIFEHTPRLAITSPEKRCGKTTLLSVISHLVPRALVASHITPAAMFRTVEKYHPTVLIDEADTFLKDNE